ncbi:MAG: GGDEF domain-containing protein [Candidatus Rokuibacteriota bacterium]
MNALLRELIQIGIALTSERDLSALLERILHEARRFTRADGGTLFVRDGGQLRFAVVQNDALASRLGEAEVRRRLQGITLDLKDPSIAGYVALTGEIVNVGDVQALPASAPLSFNRAIDVQNDYRTQSVLVVPLPDTSGNVVGVLQLINALDEHRHVIPFDPGYEDLLRSLASHAAVAIVNAQPGQLSFEDSVTGVRNGRYFTLRMEEEAQAYRHTRHHFSVVLVDVGDFRSRLPRPATAADDVLRDIARLLQTTSRGVTVIARYGGDVFAILLVDTPKEAALAYAQRMKLLIERHPFRHGAFTVCTGVATLPEDVTSDADLISAADAALQEARARA